MRRAACGDTLLGQAGKSGQELRRCGAACCVDWDLVRRHNRTIAVTD
jgi:hypothetical protein